MPLFLDIHHKVNGLTSDAIAEAHKKDLQVQQKFGVNYLKYWFNEKDGRVFCLVEAPDKESAIKVHKEAHGLLADEIFEVTEGD
jgi:hypothetical protein